MAHYDGMTGLLNRASFQEHLVRACAQPTSEKHIYAVVLMDLDNFKWVNDTLGHAAGDELDDAVEAFLRRAVSRHGVPQLAQQAPRSYPASLIGHFR